MNIKTKCIAMLVAAVGLTALGETYHVAPGGDDGADGLGWATAKATIQGGVDAAAAAGDVVLVAPGNYALGATVVVPRAITIRGSSGDPADVAVDGGGTVRCFSLTAPAALESLTIQNGNMAGVSGNGGGVDMAGGLLSNCVFRANRSGNSGGAVYTTTDTGKLTMLNCIIADNTTMNTNKTVQLSYAGGVDYCLFDTAADLVGANSKSGDPKFRTSPGSKYRLAEGSPAIHAGVTYTGIGNDLDDLPFAAIPSMGCYEFGKFTTVIVVR